jgi:integral membrane protein
MPHRPDTLKALNRVLAVALADGLLFLVLLYVAFVDRSDSAVSIIGPIHGLGFLLLLFLTAKGAGEERWGWWFPAVTLVTGGPPGSLIGDLKLRRDLKA